MFIIDMKKDDYQFLMEVSPTIFEGFIQDIKVEEDKFRLYFENYASYDKFDTNYNCAIVHFGMINQAFLNETGERMQRIYDLMIYAD
ncbi:hypothetical protein [Brochothrix thermosphacta]|uniref:Uncharacterized protein n=1 Tax=Brochothrix thermosphacta TaxID=2756 RepID=A0A1D2LUI1_BROTH|nr:hypothetical protein [Brochothrix thermosphacta]ATF26857.1 hypothetical protein CNY62_11105 [Brochothrix thermosphacta]ATH86214.1 hypothetical protein CPF12_10785 [Brochothrix thermosphacta]MPQ29685.1 hypothetical protein [Brochothrix thermosphacta]ODJ65247.1 hypothetical protein BFR36_08995 [Brochothrix thermosphacta]ODJ72968.1 hypothetical protein BFR39_12000 [Brochothrix thermosphacta]